jgi:hypothetical protein
MVVGAFLGVVAIAKPTIWPRPTWRSLLSVVVLIALSAQIWIFTKFKPFSSKGPHLLNWQMLLPHSTWLFMLASIMFIAVLNRFTKMRHHWNTHPALARAATAEITAHGITLTDAFVKSEYQWQGFQKFQETKHLFLLYTGTGSHLMIPKRAFESPEELQAMRALLKLIQAPTSGFQVVPLATGPIPATN